VGFLISNGCENTKEKDITSEIRIISLAPHITEIIYAIEAQKQIIAVTDYCRYPEEAASKEKIGGLLDPNIEKMITLNPTHIFGVPSHEKLSQELKKFGLTVTMMSNENIQDVLNSISKIGELIDRKTQANKLVNKLNYTLDSLRENDDKKVIPAVLMIGREKGTLRNITIAGNNTYINELWQLVGGKNSYMDLPTRYGTINLESLLLRDPKVIIEFDMKLKRGVYRTELSSEWDNFKNINAVKEGNIFIIGGNHTMIPGPRLILLAEDFKEIINSVRENRNLPKAAAMQKY
jgi:iron complex transport system substrate-binding protein